jgi:replicative DNA helicase Mcm
LIACNAKGGKNFDMFDPNGISSQIDIPDYILSRIDIKVMMVDKSTESETREVVSAMLAARRNVKTKAAGYLEPGFLRKYIAHARKINPELPEEFGEMIADYIISMKKEMAGNKGLKITPRQTTSIVLLAEAHARMRLKTIVEEKDVKAAIELFDMCFRNVNTNPQNGQLDMGLSTSNKDKNSLHQLVLNNIAQIEEETKKPASEMSILANLKKLGKNEDRIMMTIRQLKYEGKIYEPTSGAWRRMK